MSSTLLAVLVCLHTSLAINFPGLRVPLGRPRTSIYSAEACTDVSVTGATSTTPVVLSAGEGRQFTSPGYDGSSTYSASVKCLWTFVPAAGATLTFSCSAFSVPSTAAVGETCAGDFLRFYDNAVGNSLDDKGERYCHSTGPTFSYSSEIQVLFRSAASSTGSTGFDCEVVASVAAPTAADCTTVAGPGSGKACMPFTYGSHRIAYDGCINRATPEQYIATVPSFEDAPSDSTATSASSSSVAEEEDFLENASEIFNFGGETFDFGSESFGFGGEFGAISFGPAPRGAVRPRQGAVRPRHGAEEMVFRTVFWCATAADPSGYVMEWGQCAPGCKADPAGSYVPVAPRRTGAPRSDGKGFTHARQGQTVGQLTAIIKALAAKTTGPSR